MASGGLCRQTSLKKKIHQTICPCSSSIRAQGMSSASLCRRVDCDASHCPQMGEGSGPNRCHENSPGNPAPRRRVGESSAEQPHHSRDKESEKVVFAIRSHEVWLG